MNVRLNGEEQEVPEDLSVEALLEWLGIRAGPVAVEVNREIVPRGRRAETCIADGDRIEIVSFTGGG